MCCVLTVTLFHLYWTLVSHFKNIREQFPFANILQFQSASVDSIE